MSEKKEAKAKTGRKPKYATEEERRKAKAEQVRACRERKKKLIGKEEEEEEENEEIEEINNKGLDENELTELVMEVAKDVIEDNNKKYDKKIEDMENKYNDKIKQLEQENKVLLKQNEDLRLGLLKEMDIKINERIERLYDSYNARLLNELKVRMDLIEPQISNMNVNNIPQILNKLNELISKK